jgi:hypothetical protein
LKGPICLAKTPPRKSYIPHPNIPITPVKMLKMVILMILDPLPSTWKFAGGLSMQQ